jgi:hypothetical protein
MNAALDLQEVLFDAQSCSAAKPLQYLAQADAALNKLRLYLRLAHRFKWLNDGQYQHISALVAEIGRLLGGWMKTVRNEKKR